MFDSKVKASDLIKIIKGEVDAAPDIPDDVYLRFIDETEQLLYSEIIREIHVVLSAARDEKSPAVYKSRLISLPIAGEAGGDPVRFEDIHAVFAQGTQLVKTAPTGHTFPDSYCRIGNDLYINSDLLSNNDTVAIYYNIRPALKSREGGRDDTIKLPLEWLPIITSKMRGEAYKLVNEDSAAAKWLNDYNYLLEEFKVYMAKRATEFGEIN